MSASLHIYPKAPNPHGDPRVYHCSYPGCISTTAVYEGARHVGPFKREWLVLPDGRAFCNTHQWEVIK